MEREWTGDRRPMGRVDRVERIETGWMEGGMDGDSGADGEGGQSGEDGEWVGGEGVD